jgi:hypothetical protein
MSPLGAEPATLPFAIITGVIYPAPHSAASIKKKREQQPQLSTSSSSLSLFPNMARDQAAFPRMQLEIGRLIFWQKSGAVLPSRSEIFH